MKLLILCALVLSGCANLPIKDFTACADAGPDGSHCDNFLTSAPVDLNKSEWDALRGTGYLCMSPDDFGNIKIEIEQACSIANCSYEQKKTMQLFFSKMKPLRSK